jgi:hypothetical protein
MMTTPIYFYDLFFANHTLQLIVKRLVRNAMTPDLVPDV